MTDIFISYAHEDQPFVRRMVPVLEAEGFSVWWDHTIPPGRTWHTYIARGLEDAKACIVVWSQRSVSSKWVLEEASLASDADKLLPVQVDDAVPPMGFRRLQAAKLANWHGNADDPQWRLLIGEVRTLVGPTSLSSVSEPPPNSVAGSTFENEHSEPKLHRSSRRWLLIGGMVFAAAAALALTTLQGPPAQEWPTEYHPTQEDRALALAVLGVWDGTIGVSGVTTELRGPFDFRLLGAAESAEGRVYFPSLYYCSDIPESCLSTESFQWRAINGYIEMYAPPPDPAARSENPWEEVPPFSATVDGDMMTRTEAGLTRVDLRRRCHADATHIAPTDTTISTEDLGC